MDIKKLPSLGKNYGSNRATSNIHYLVFHYTGNKTDTAKANATYFSKNVVGASAHYFVDDSDIYQSVEDSMTAWAVGKNYGSGNQFGIVTNGNSISIEMCSKGGVITEATQKKAIELGKYLMKKYSIKGIYTHYEVCSKQCPGWAGWYGKDNSKWLAFKANLTGSSVSTKNATATASSDGYYKKYTGDSTSLIAALNAVGVKDTSLAARKKIGQANNISSYTGTALQNMKLLALLKAGKLKKA